MTFLNYVSLENFETMMAVLGIFPAHLEKDPDGLVTDNESKLYILTNHALFVQEAMEGRITGYKKHHHHLEHVFIRHVVGDAADALTLEPIIAKTAIHSAIVMGTQQNSSNRMDAQMSLSQSPKARDTRVLCIFLLLRKLMEQKFKDDPENTEPMHGK